MKKDKLHFNFRRVDSYNKVFNFVISEREAGKSTAVIMKAYRAFKKKHKTTLIIKRLIADITETYIVDFGKVINKFQPKDKQVELEFKKGSIKEGVVDVFIAGKHFIRIIALSNPMSRFKSTMIKDPAMVIFDEFICNNRAGEKYIENEAFKFKEIYNTYQRECRGILKCYFLGNPYSLYNPYFSDLNVDTLQLRPGAFIVGPNYIISCYRIKEELRQAILKRNPLYQFDEAYKRYAFDGLAVNDSNFIINPVRPEKFYLRYTFRLNNKYLTIWSNNSEDNYWQDCKYYIECAEPVNQSRKMFAIDFNNLVANTNLITPTVRILFGRLKQAIAMRNVVFNNIEAGYLTEELYTAI